MEMFAFASAVRGYRVYQDLWKPSIREKLVAKREFHNPMDKQAVKEVKGDETVGHLSRKFSQIMQYFLARSGEIGFEVIGQKCAGLEAQSQLEFNCSNESTNETLERTTGEQDLGATESMININNRFHYV